MTGGADSLTATTPTLTLASSFTVNASGYSESISGATTLVSGAAINLTGTASSLNINMSTLINSGTIAAASGDTLKIGAANQSLAISGPGIIAMAPGSTLALGAIETTAQVQSLIAPYTGVALELTGTLNNAGTTLATAATGTLTDLLLGADVLGGTVLNGGGTVQVIGGTFVGVTFDGPLNLEGDDASLEILGGLSLQSAAGAPGGTINFTNEFQFLKIADSETLDGTVINVGTLYDYIEAEFPNTTIAFGPSVTLNDFRWADDRDHDAFQCGCDRGRTERLARHRRVDDHQQWQHRRGGWRCARNRRLQRRPVADRHRRDLAGGGIHAGPPGGGNPSPDPGAAEQSARGHSRGAGHAAQQRRHLRDRHRVADQCHSRCHRAGRHGGHRARPERHRR